MYREKSSKSTVAGFSVLVLALALLSGAASASNRYGATYFPNVPLTTQDGTKVHFYDDVIKGKIVVIDLIYTQCVDSCPLETARLVQVQKMLGDRVVKDIFFYSISNRCTLASCKKSFSPFFVPHSRSPDFRPWRKRRTTRRLGKKKSALSKPATVSIRRRKMGFYSSAVPASANGRIS